GFFFVSILVATFVTEVIAHHDENLRGVYRYSLTFPNTGGVGTPLMLAMYGTAGYFQLSLFILPFSIGTYVWGIEQLMPLTAEHPKHKLTWRGLLNAAMVAELIGFLLGITNVAQYLPELIPDTLQKLGACYPLLALILLGYVIADYDPKEIIDLKADFVIALFRLILIPAAYLGLLTVIGAPQIVRVITGIAFACPCGMNTVVYGTAYGQDSRIGAGLLLVTNLLAVLTMPLIQLLV
ncbi:MAG: AEC family transporter, partial [Lachnospiraceae bacterium]|nr:AEC family transporter [Lachnospiraceae bacterium]